MGDKTLIEKYMDREISSSDYFREVRKETVREVQRDLEQPPPKVDKT